MKRSIRREEELPNIKSHAVIETVCTGEGTDTQTKEQTRKPWNRPTQICLIDFQQKWKSNGGMTAISTNVAGASGYS